MNDIHQQDGQATEYVTVQVDDRLFGLPIARVQEVFTPDRLTRVPLASPEVAGILNLRGRIVTAIDLRCRLGLPARSATSPAMAVGIDVKGESYGLLVDAVAEVVSLSDESCEPCPAHLEPALMAVASAVVRLDAKLLILVDVDRVLDVRHAAVAA